MTPTPPPASQAPVSGEAYAPRMADGRISPKTLLAVVAGALATALLTVLEQILDITIDPTAKVAIAGAIVTLAGGLGAFRGKPGQVEVARGPSPPPL